MTRTLTQTMTSKKRKTLSREAAILAIAEAREKEWHKGDVIDVIINGLDGMDGWSNAKLEEWHRLFCEEAVKIEGKAKGGPRP